jgi:hypothetical protein
MAKEIHKTAAERRKILNTPSEAIALKSNLFLRLKIDIAALSEM